MNALPPLDPLLATLGVDAKTRADRLNFATGELLGADDFVAEQTYHRRQLARALLLLHGSGTIAGLRVKVQRPDPPDPEDADEMQLVVEPGLAIDRAGRLIEVSRPQVLRLRRWFRFIAQADPARTPAGQPDRDDLRGAFEEGSNRVVADVFLRFFPSPREPSPSFATGPFDALDASQPSRMRDGHELRLVLRTERTTDVPPAVRPVRPFDPWRALEVEAQLTPAQFAAAVAADPGAWPPERRERWQHLQADQVPGNTVRSLRALSLAGWDLHQLPAEPIQNAVHEYPAGFDPAAVLLARVRLPALAGAPGAPPAPDFTDASWRAGAVAPETYAQPDNFVRNFVLPPALVLRAGVAFQP